jgi:hypothetical protein
MQHQTNHLLTLRQVDGARGLALHQDHNTRTELLYTTVAIFSAPAINIKVSGEKCASWLEDVMKAAIVSAAPRRSGWAP